MWWTRRGSNPQPLPCKGTALPVELLAHKIKKANNLSTIGLTFLVNKDRLIHSCWLSSDYIKTIIRFILHHSSLLYLAVYLGTARPLTVFILVKVPTISEPVNLYCYLLYSFLSIMSSACFLIFSIILASISSVMD